MTTLWNISLVKKVYMVVENSVIYNRWLLSHQKDVTQFHILAKLLTVQDIKFREIYNNYYSREICKNFLPQIREHIMANNT